MQGTIKIGILVEGGIVQFVRASQPNIEVTVYDADVLKEGDEAFLDSALDAKAVYESLKFSVL